MHIGRKLSDKWQMSSRLGIMLTVVASKSLCAVLYICDEGLLGLADLEHLGIADLLVAQPVDSVSIFLLTVLEQLFAARKVSTPAVCSE